jgi:thiosulfate/3-mercaptopyruvate sulfurtransferase
VEQNLSVLPESRGYAHADRLVTTEWLAERLDDPSVRVLESNEDPLLYAQGHIAGAGELDWARDLNDPLRRDYLDAGQFSALMGRLGVRRESTVVLYGDKNNWWATYAAWVLHLFGHPDVRILDGGRLKWMAEGRPLTRDVPRVEPTEYPVVERDDARYRAFRDDVLAHLEKQGKMIDVRSPEEYRGERLHMEAYPNEGALRGGHIPGAKNVPWARAVDPATGEFLPADRLRELYEAQAELAPGDDVVVYCRIGERSSHTWFVLKYLLGYDSVRNYDGSWTEWGNLVGAPIER